MSLSGEECLEYVRARNAIQGFANSLDAAATEYRDAKEILRGGSLVEAGRYYARQRLLEIPKKTVHEVYAEMLLAKKAEGCSERYIQDLESRVSKFASAFGQRQVGGVLGVEIKDWLQGLQHATSKKDPGAPKVAVTNRTRNNFRLCVQTLFSFAKAQRYLPSDWNEMESVPLWKVKAEVEIFTPEEMTLLLALAPANLVTFLTIGAFAGLRSAEIERLDWAKVDLEGGYLTVDASIAKTNSRRLVPIPANLKKWLAPYKTNHGKVLELANVVNAIQRLENATRRPNGPDEAAGDPQVTWKHNALRHSFCGYRLAQVKNAAEVALEAGNSPQMIFQHYRKLVTERAAKEWFGITPEAAAEVRAQVEGERQATIVAFPANVAA